jgi:hypothetical protein
MVHTYTSTYKNILYSDENFDSGLLSSTRKMKMKDSSETFVITYKNTWRHSPDDHNKSNKRSLRSLK